MSTPVIFDIETGPLPDEQLRKIIPPFDRNTFPPPRDFDPSTIKYGNLGEAKRAEKLQAEQKKHADAVQNYAADLAAKQYEYWAEATSKAALSALTGEVLAIGYRGEKRLIDCVGDETPEAALLARFWSQYRNLRKAGRKMVGYNIAFFDVPFLVQRSWLHGVAVPDTVFTHPGRYLDPTYIDLAQVWSGSARNGFVKLDTIAKAFGLDGKPDGINGGDFARLFHNPDTRHEAIAYLEGDIDMTYEIAVRVGVA